MPPPGPRRDPATGEAVRYLRLAGDRPGAVSAERTRLVDLLVDADPDDSERRAAASGALARLSRAAPGSLREFLPDLLAELRRETRAVAGSGTDRPATGVTLEHLVATVAHVVDDDPTALGEVESVEPFVRALGADLDAGTALAGIRGLFAGAGEAPGAVAPAAAELGDLTRGSDPGLRAWAAGTLGRVATARPDAVVPVAEDLHRLLRQGEGAALHNAVEALGALVQERPAAVAPAAADIRELLDHEDTAVQHNAAGVLGRLAATHPDLVVPAVDRLDGLREHEEAAVREVATLALGRLARERPGAIADP